MRKTLVTAIVLLLVGCAPAATSRPGRSILAELHAGRSVGPPVVAAGGVWVPNEADGTVSHIDPGANRVVATVAVGDLSGLLSAGCGPDSVHSFMRDTLLNRRCDDPSSIAGDGRWLWAADNAAQGLARIDPRSDRVVQRVPLGADPFAIALGAGSLWVTVYFHDPHEVLRVDPSSGRVLATITDLPLGGGTGIAVDEGGVWVACTYAHSLVRIDPSTNQVAAVIPVQEYPLAVSAGRGTVWVRNEDSSSVSRVDPASNRVVATIAGMPAPVGRTGDDAMALGRDGLWVSGIQLIRVDPNRNRVAARIDLSGAGVAEGFGALWMTSIFGTVQRIDPRVAVPVGSG